MGEAGGPAPQTRRQFIQGVGAAGLALAAGCGRLPGQAQPSAVPRIGYLSAFQSSDGLSAAFAEGLSEQGYVDGKNILVEYRFADGQDTRLPAMASELAGLPVSIIVASGAARAASGATHSIPVVMAADADPVGAGLVAGLARPGGNVTGSTLMTAQLSAKRLSLLTDTTDGVARVAVLGNTAFPGVAAQLEEMEAVAPVLGVQLFPLALRDASEIAASLGPGLRERADALIILLDPVVNANLRRIVDQAAQSRLPTMGYVKPFAVAGALMSYGPSHEALHRRAAYYVDRILKGASPADLPVEQPTIFDFVINLKTAQALGLTIPQHVLLQATEIIQ